MPILKNIFSFNIFFLLLLSSVLCFDQGMAFSKGNLTTEELKAEVKEMLREYQEQFAELEKAKELRCWDAAVSGKKEDFDSCAEKEIKVKKFHSDKDRYEKIQGYLKRHEGLDPLDIRSLEIALLHHKENQLPENILSEMVKLSTEINQIFNTFRAKLGGSEHTNNELLERLRTEKDGEKRQEIWSALKLVGTEVSQKLIQLAHIRNKAAKHLGYSNFWEMEISLQDYLPNELLGIFSELEKTTDAPFKKMKSSLDAELARRFKIKASRVMPWHYDNPFFQEAPPSEKVNFDDFYTNKKKEDIVTIAKTFYDDIGFSIDDILNRSDLYEKPGKDQHAFCTSIDRADDVRTLQNVKADSHWMDTVLHELGHAIDSRNIDRSLPFVLREHAHIFSTEGVALLFGALTHNPSWLVAYAGADKKKVASLSKAILEQRRREQLIFSRWTLVMLHFEKNLYEDPAQDLNKLWWDYAERFQLVKRPAGRNLPDWAAKPHFTIAPVYYHNYMMGELFAAQIRSVLGKLSKHKGPASELSFNGRKEFGDLLKEKVFRPGKSRPWPEFVKLATEEPLTAKYFANETK